MSFDLSRAIEDLVLADPPPRAFLDRLISLMYFSELQVMQQFSSDRFGQALGLIGVARYGGAAKDLLLVTPIDLLGDPSRNLPVVSKAQRTAKRADLVSKVWIASLARRLQINITVLAYRPDPLGLNLKGLLEDLVSSNLGGGPVVVLYGGSSEPQAVTSLPASVSVNLPIKPRMSQKERRCTSLLVLSRRVLDVSRFLERLAGILSPREGGIYHLQIGGLDRSPMNYAYCVVDHVSPRWPSHWKVYNRPCPASVPMDPLAVQESVSRCHGLAVRGLSLPYYVEAEDQLAECHFLVVPRRVQEFLDLAKSQVQLGNMELFMQPQAKGQGIFVPGVVSLFHAKHILVVRPPDPNNITNLLAWTTGLIERLKEGA